MAKITDPDDLIVGKEITLDPEGSPPTFGLVVAGNLVAKDGVTGNALWAKFVDLWAYAPSTSTVSTVSTASWSSQVATIDCSAAHNLTTGDIVEISGVTPSGYNVTGVVNVTDADSFEIYIGSDPGSYTSGGTVTPVTYQPYPFPMNILDARSGQYIFGQDPGGSYNGWKPYDDAVRQKIRDAGWQEYSSGGSLNREYVGIVALASGFPGAAQFYYQRTSTGSKADFTFTDAPNEAIQVYGDVANGDFDERTYFKIFCREAGYLYDDAVLGDVGETGTGPYKVQLPIAVGADLDIQDNDTLIETSVSVSTASWVGGTATFDTSTVHGLTTGDIVSITGVTPDGYNVVGPVTVSDTDTFTIAITSDPGSYTSGGTVKSGYDLVKARYFTGTFSRDIDSTTNREFGIVIDAGTHSGIDGSAPGAGSVLTTSEGGMAVDYFIGGKLVIYEGTDENLEFDITDNDATTITVDGTLSSGSNLSFTVFPPAKRTLGMDLQQIYTKVQYLLRQNSNINSVSGSVTGATAALLLNFVGPSLKCGAYAPTNPNGGGTGVLIQGILDADLNSIVYYDNSAATREYPYASAGTLNFNSALTQGGAGYYRMYFTTLPGADNDYGESGAVTVDDKDGADIEGTISAGSIPFTFDYSNNNQGGRTPGTDAAVTVIAGNPGYAKPVVATGLINQSKAISITLTAETDRAYIS
jgi:hypothetical protein